MNGASKAVVVLIGVVAVILTAMPLSAADIGQQIYTENCASCHGSNGSGKTAYAKKVPTPDLRSKEVQQRSDDELYLTVARGVGHVNYPHGYEMRGMSKDKILAVIQYVRTLK
jgi:mono/diheme cytochrome c family protein